jgi:ferredoxin-NADP reductase
MKLQLISATERGQDIKEFAFRPMEPFSWKAGQYMHYVLPHQDPDDRGIERWFTISAAPSENEIRITTRIDHEHGSSFKRALEALNPGDQIEADGPKGEFVIDDPTRNYLFIIGGIGITPLRSILVEAAARGVQLHVNVLYANRTSDAPFRSELDKLCSQSPNLKIQYVIEPERIDEPMLKTALQSIPDAAIYISGPKPMVLAMKEQLLALGADESRLKLDTFPGYEGI